MLETPYSDFRKRLTEMIGQEETQSEKTKAASRNKLRCTDFGIIREFKITVTKILRALIEKVDNMKEEMGDKNREVETIRKNQKET